jgi:hypothetical protein
MNASAMLRNVSLPENWPMIASKKIATTGKTDQFKIGSILRCHVTIWSGCLGRTLGSGIVTV